MKLKRRGRSHNEGAAAPHQELEPLDEFFRLLTGLGRRATTLMMSTLLASAAIASTAQPAYAFSCVPGRPAAGGTYSADVARNLGGTANGVSALIMEYDPYTTDATGTNVSVMLTQGSIDGWAQLGWFKTKIRAPDGHIGTMHRSSGVEFHPQTGSPNWQFWSPKPIDRMTWYEINHDTTANKFLFFIEGTDVWEQSNPMPTTVYEVITETHQKQDAYPGNVADPVVIDNVNYFTPPGYTPHVATDPILPNINAQPFAGLYPANGQASTGKYKVWDTACP
jgi:hypothetical protein